MEETVKFISGIVHCPCKKETRIIPPYIKKLHCISSHNQGTAEYNFTIENPSVVLDNAEKFL
jgi:hypothetical protein